MTDLEINIAIAEACGYQIEPSQAKGGWRLYNEQSETSFWWNCDRPPTLSDVSYRLPNYCSDLNAMHEVWSGLSETEKAVFVDELYAVTPSTSYEDRYTGATARQRAEAFLRTIGKWKP